MKKQLLCSALLLAPDRVKVEISVPEDTYVLLVEHAKGQNGKPAVAGKAVA